MPGVKLDLALPLFALVARDKIDPEQSDLTDLAGRLGDLLQHQHGIAHEAVSIEGGAAGTGSAALYLVLIGVPQSSWPAFIALSEVQKAQPFVFRAAEDGRFSLHPLGTSAKN